MTKRLIRKGFFSNPADSLVLVLNKGGKRIKLSVRISVRSSSLFIKIPVINNDDVNTK